MAEFLQEKALKKSSPNFLARKPLQFQNEGGKKFAPQKSRLGNQLNCKGYFWAPDSTFSADPAAVVANPRHPNLFRRP
jgi:hypothetical protein